MQSMKIDELSDDVKESVGYLSKLISSTLGQLQSDFGSSMSIIKPIFCKQIKVYEIRLSNCIIGCYFDKADFCCGGFIFFHNQDEIPKYINYLNDNFFHKSECQWWNDSILIELSENGTGKVIEFYKPDVEIKLSMWN